MTYLTESFAWCVLQVTLFSLVAAVLYLVVHRLRPGASSALLASSLSMVGLLTLACASPWPQWDAGQWSPARTAVSERDIAKFVAPMPALLDAPARPLPRSGTVPTIVEPRLAVTEKPAAVSASARSVSSTTKLRWFALAAWFVIALGCLKTIVGFFHVRRICRSSMPIEDADVLQISRGLCGELAIRRSVGLRESSQLGAAATVGWRRPIVMLPLAWREWSDAEMRAVLAHELAHVRLRHFPTWLVSQVTLAAHYYHPVVHWLTRRLRLEHEIDADQLAANLFGDRRQYATILARLALQPMPATNTDVGVSLFMSRPLLMRRIAMLRQSSNPIQSSRFGRAAVLLLLVAAAIGVAGLRAEQPVRADEAAPPPPTTAEAAPAEPAPAAVSAEPAVAAPGAPAAGPRFLGPIAAQPAVAAKPVNDAVSVSSLLRVSRLPAAAGGGGPQPMSDSAWKVYSNTQVQLLSSHIVLQSALRSPAIAALPILKGQKYPVAWLQRRLGVGFYVDTDILYVELRVKPDEAEDARQLVDAIVEAYMKEIVNADRMWQLDSRDRLARSLAKLNDEVQQKLEQYYDIARELGTTEDGGHGQVQQQINLRRLDRAETELMRLEDEFAKAKASQTSNTPPWPAIEAYFKQRIAELNKRVAELEEKLNARSSISVELVTRKAEIEQLQKIVAETSRKLELMDISADVPEDEPIRVIQRAVVAGADTE